MAARDSLEQARSAFARRAWAEARTAYRHADPPEGPDLEAWGLAAGLTGHDEEADDARERAHHAYLGVGDHDGAARVAFWLGLSLVMRGEPARGRGWFGRMRSVVGEAFPDSVWAGYDALNQGMMTLFSGDLDRSLVVLGDALEIAARHHDIDLLLLAGSGHGQVLLALGRTAEGMAELDEVMVGATSSDASPQVVGRVYCAVIAVCRGCLDLARSAEWTEVLSRWCDSQPDLVPFRGQCLVHRSEVLQVRGRWDDAATEVEKVIAHEIPAGDPAGGLALYQRAELHRLRGEFRAAERAYRDALAAGHDPQPGLALMRLVQGRGDAAMVALRRALAEARLVFTRVQLLPAVVEVALAVGEAAAARSAADELAEHAQRLDSAYVRATAATARGAVAIGADDPRAALTALREAVAEWASLEAPYDGARCRLLLAAACRTLGDAETAGLETDAARQVLTALGAKVDLDLLDGDGAGTEAPDGLTPREVEVLCLVATGASNRDIAERLVLSESTVARHVANIFVKIGVSARAAATAYAYDHHLV